nr:ABC transporter substrate-binding protein [Flavobacterium sp. MK4S-17]
MKQIHKFLAIAIVVLATASCKKETEKNEGAVTAADSTAVEKQRIVSLNSAITEIVSATGHQDEIVGVDVTSTYPENIKETAKDLGHIRSISIESIMALQPTLILGTDKDISPELEEKIKQSGVKHHIFTQEISVEGTKQLIKDVASVFNAEYEPIQAKIDDALASNVKPLDKKPKVLFIYARGANQLMVSGTGTPVDKVITLAGAENAVKGFEDYKPLTPEALIQSNPDVILMFDSGIGSLGGPQGVWQIPGMDKTNAGKNKKIISMDGGLLSSFGPRLGQAVEELNGKLMENAK